MRTFEIHLSMYSHKDGDPIFVTKYESSWHQHNITEERARELYAAAQDALEKK